MTNSGGSTSVVKFCPNCGKSISSKAPKFCGECGASLGAQSVTQEPSVASQTKSSSKAVSVIGFIVLAAIIYFFISSSTNNQVANTPSNTNVVVPEPVVDSYNIGLNAGKGLAAQNTLLYPNRTAMCGQVFQNYSGQSLDFDKFMAGCQDGFN